MDGIEANFFGFEKSVLHAASDGEVGTEHIYLKNSPKAFDAVLVEDSIRTQQWQSLYHRLRNQQTVEWPSR